MTIRPTHGPTGRVRAAVAALSTAAALTCTGLIAAAAPTAAAPTGCAPADGRSGSIGGIVHPVRTGASCAGSASMAPATAPPYVGAPPLINHGGPVMSVPSVNNKVIVTPIYWAPSGYNFTASYKSVTNSYLANLAADSGKSTNVFASLTQYPGSNGSITYGIQTAPAITDTDAFPAAGCVINSGAIYSDNSGYTTCLDDAQLATEINAVITAGGLAHDFGHLYVLFTPKGVESCFEAGNPVGQACTINRTSSSAFCAYHSFFGAAGTPSIYANMPFPVYQSAAGSSCTDESLGGGIQSPNGDVDADVEVSPLSHEMSEAITDPELDAWYDKQGFENGDDCAYIYGPLAGPAGARYNQVINGAKYLTQEEFSNDDYVKNVSGCIQQEEGASTAPTITSVAPTSGSAAGGQTVTIKGTGFTGATAVTFGTTAATSYTVVSAIKITAKTPAHAAGLVDVSVTTDGGTSAVVVADRYTFTAAGGPTITSIAPVSGSPAGGQTVTIKGTGFTGATAVTFGSTAAASYTVVSAIKITARTPAHAAGLVDVSVTTAGGTSAAVAADQYTFAPAPTVTSVAPSTGPAAGGQTITITGTEFTGVTAVKFNSVAAASFTVVTPTSITAVTPPGSGRVNVKVTAAGGTSAAVATDKYTYV